MMNKTEEQIASAADLATQPFLYEIRVRGRLSEEQWTSWFDNLTVAAAGGETMLRGSLPDHAALYGLLARLRDLAIPLLAVNVLDAEAQRKMNAKLRRFTLMFNLLMLLAYLTLGGGLTAITVLLTSGGMLHTALGLAILFALLGILAFGFFLWSRKKPWRWAAAFLLPSSLLTFLIYVAVSELIHPTLAIGIILFYVAGAMIYVLVYLRGRTEALENQMIEWESFGSQPESVAEEPAAEKTEEEPAAEKAEKDPEK